MMKSKYKEAFTLFWDGRLFYFCPAGTNPVGFKYMCYSLYLQICGQDRKRGGGGQILSQRWAVLLLVFS